ncbi:MAG: RNA polymerase sigma factor [Acidobacteriota bacterium]
MQKEPLTLESLVENARKGDRDALEAVVRRIQDSVYGLALRMLWHPADAEDASQEILIKVVTHLSTFRGESAFTTWVYRIASNFLLTTRRRRAEQEEVTFEQFAAQLNKGLSDEPFRVSSDVDHKLLIEEVKIGCTHGMLLCLDREHRLAYILGEIFEVTSNEGAYILGVAPAAFRKRLSRARNRIRNFMQRNCGLVNSANPCRCTGRVKRAIELERVDPKKLLFATHPVNARREPNTLERVREMRELQGAAAVFRSHPDYAAPGAFVEAVRKLISSGQFKVLGGERPQRA